MPTHDPFDDPFLGRVMWAPGPRAAWEFSLTLPTGRVISGNITPSDGRKTLHEQGLEDIKSRIRGIVDNEAAIRARIAESMFPGWWQNWYDEEIDTVTAVEGFRDAIFLVGITVYEDGLPQLHYRDGGLFGGHAIEVTLTADGGFKYEPQIWG
jgi:hypothetical protein